MLNPGVANVSSIASDLKSVEGSTLTEFEAYQIAVEIQRNVYISTNIGDVAKALQSISKELYNLHGAVHTIAHK
jgi:hypothetical protein